jgi:hypothetical protein
VAVARQRLEGRPRLASIGWLAIDRPSQRHHGVGPKYGAVRYLLADGMSLPIGVLGRHLVGRPRHDLLDLGHADLKCHA